MLLAWMLVLLAAAACGEKRLAPPGGAEPDRYLFEQGTSELNEKHWLRAREYFRQIVDGYPQSSYRADAKLGVGDTYIGEGTTESYLLAIGEFREFLTFFPTHTRADYAHYRLAYAHHRQMLAPDRDQTETKETIKELQAFVERYPNSSMLGEARAMLREALDRLSESEFRVGLFYFRSRWYPGAIDRFKALLKSDPAYTHRDAVYFHLAESLLKLNRQAEALPYYQQLLDEFIQSEYIEEARKRLAELKAGPGTVSGR